MHRSIFSTNIKTPNVTRVKTSLSALLGATALLSLGLSTPLMADTFVITFGTTINGTGTTNGGTAAPIAATAINGDDTVTLTGTLNNTSMVEGEGGIETTGTNTITVSTDGIIRTVAVGADGVWNTGDTNITTMSGSITTSGFSSFGISNQGASNNTTISDTGSITTSGDHGYGIANDGSSNINTVSGSITTSGEKARGIYNLGNSNINTVSGSITTSGEKGFGIYNEGNSNRTEMSGSIIATGLGGIAIVDEGNSNKTTISGIISVNVDDYTGTLDPEEEAYGVGIGYFAYGNNNTATISGSITVVRPYAYGAVTTGLNNSIAISGTVKASGSKSIALYALGGDGGTFTLNEGAVIIGQIKTSDEDGGGEIPLSTNNKLVFNLGESKSYAYYIAGTGVGTGVGQWTFSDLDGRTQGVTAGTTGCDLTDEKFDYSTPTVCNLVTAVSAGNAEVQNELSYLNNSAVVNSLRGAKATHKDAEGNSAWVDVYRGSSKRTASTTDLTVSSFKSNTSGLTIGSPFMIGSTTQADFVFNSSRTNLDLSSAKDQTVKLTANKIGLVLDDLAPTSGWKVGAFGLVGANSYKGTRKVMTNTSSTGSESITSSYRGTEVIVGASADKVQPISDTLRFEGGIDFNYTNENIASYSESKYFTWDSRRTTHAAAGITAGLVYEKDGLTAFGTVGTQRSNLMSGKTATYTTNGTAGSYTDSAKSDTYNTVSIGVSYKGSNGMSLTGNVSNSRSNNKVSGAITRLGFNWKF